MANLPADPRLRRELLAKRASVLEVRMEREELTLRQVAEMLGVSRPPIADPLKALMEGAVCRPDDAEGNDVLVEVTHQGQAHRFRVHCTCDGTVLESEISPH